MSNTLFEKLKKFVDLNRKEKSRPGERNLTRYPIAAAVSDRLVRVIQPRKSTDAPRTTLMCHCEERSDVAILQDPVR